MMQTSLLAQALETLCVESDSYNKFSEKIVADI